MRLLHLSDIHLWAWPRGPRDLLGKRLIASAELAFGRAAKFRLERLAEVVARAVSLAPDHVLITGDLTTSALPAEFTAARLALTPLLTDPQRATVVPGNHDRYTRRATRAREFEHHFGPYLPAPTFPWTRPLADRITILGLDPCRPHLTATGHLPASQLDRARSLLASTPDARPLIACHYPLDAPDAYRHNLRRKRLTNAAQVADWLRAIGPHLYCCGHVHAAWAFHPPAIPNQLCLNAGAPLLRDPHHPRNRPGFLEITLQDDAVRVTHHGWDEAGHWITNPLADEPTFWTNPR